MRCALRPLLETLKQIKCQLEIGIGSAGLSAPRLKVHRHARLPIRWCDEWHQNGEGTYWRCIPVNCHFRRIYG